MAEIPEVDVSDGAIFFVWWWFPFVIYAMKYIISMLERLCYTFTYENTQKTKRYEPASQAYC